MKPKKPIKRTQVGDRQRAAKRRIEILQLIIKAGHPRAISQESLAKHYKVSQVAICKDIQAIAKEVKENLPKDAEFVTHVVLESAVKSLSKGNPDQKFKAAKLILDWNNYLFEMGKQIRAPQRHEIDTNVLFGGVNINIIKPDNDNNKLETDKKTTKSLRDSK